MAGLLEVQRDPNTISRVSACLPGKPATYRLTSADREALVQRISVRKQWRPILVRIWVGEMERFLAIKSFTDDTDASKASPSGAAACEKHMHTSSMYFHLMCGHQPARASNQYHRVCFAKWSCMLPKQCSECLLWAKTGSKA